MEDVLKEGGESRKLAVCLKHLQYGDQLVDQLLHHSASMEKLYGTLQGMVARGVTNDAAYDRVLDVYDEKSKWFEKAKAGL